MEDLKFKLENEKSETQRLTHELADTRGELDLTRRSGLTNANQQVEANAKAAEELRSCKKTIVDLEDVIEGLRRKEQKLVAEQKKKSETARQLVTKHTYFCHIYV